MELKKLIRILWQRMWVVVVAAVLVGGVTYGISITTPPRYAATTTLNINSGGDPRTDPYSAYRFAQASAQTYVEQLKSPLITRQVIDRVGNIYDAGEDLSVTQVRDTQLIRVRVVHEDRELAKLIADTTAEVFIEHVDSQQQARFQQGLDDIETQIADIELEMAETREAIASLTELIDAGDGEGSETLRLELTRRQTELPGLQTRYGILLRSAEDFRLAMARYTDSVSVFDPAVSPRKPVRPRPMLNAGLGLLAGVILGLSTALLLEYLDDSIRDPEELERELGLTVLGSVAPMKSLRQRSEALLTEPIHGASTIESFLTLRTNLSFADVDNPSGSIVVTSVRPEEGKTTTLANLGIVMAQAGRKVILVDADLRRPVLHELFGLDAAPGLTDLLLEDDPQPEAYMRRVGVEGLSVLTSGKVPKNPPDLLSSKKMSRLVAALESQADVVLFDAPPVMGLADASVLAAQTTSVLLVADAQQTRRDALRKAKELLQRADAHVVGVFLNRLAVRRGDGYYQYAGYHYQQQDSENQTGRRWWRALFGRRESRRGQDAPRQDGI